MDKAEAKAIMAEAQTALNAIFAAHGLDTTPVRGVYDAGSLKLTVTGKGRGDAAPTVLDWAKYCGRYGLPLEALGSVVTVGGKPYRIDGLIPSRPKFPIAVMDLNAGKKMLLTVPSVKRALGLTVEPWER